MPPTPPTAAQPPPTTTTQNAPPLLLCEALGFSPQLLLDDIINIANNAVQDGVNGMEEFLAKWAEERDATASNQPPANARSDEEEATTHEVEQGLVAFQTLLEYHTDIAFDFFEAWCLRNIFVIPPDLPVVLPHQAGLDLTLGPEVEAEAVEEVEELRKRLDGQRKLNRLLKRSLRTSTRQLTHAQTRLTHLSTLAAPSPTLPALLALPPQFLSLYHTLAALPPLDLPPAVALEVPGKRQWETSRSGYANWAVGRLLVRAEAGEGGGGAAVVDRMERAAGVVGSGAELRRAVEVVGGVGRGEEEGEEGMEE